MSSVDPIESPEARQQTFAFIDRVARLRFELKEAVGRVVIGLNREIDLLLIALLSRGHVLLEGVPGVAKTLLARTFAHCVGGEFQRIQFTPDLLPTDVTGGAVYDRRTGDFVIKRGPVFTNILLADEINRSPAKTQSALLEAMQERQVTLEGTAYSLPEPFIVLATQNPVEEEGVYKLPEAQLDRFFLRVRFPYPSLTDEVRILKTHSKPVPPPERVTSCEEILDLQSRIDHLELSEVVYRTVSEFAQRTRHHPAVALGLSPRASLCLLEAARAKAVLGGRDYVTHEDLKELIDPVLSHRIILRPEAEMDGIRPQQVLHEVFESMELWEGGNS